MMHIGTHQAGIVPQQRVSPAPPVPLCPHVALRQKSPNGGDTGQQGRADSPAGGSDAARGSCDHFNPVAGVSGAGGLESRNPFHTTYGMLPGTSVLAYQIFIPGCEEPPAPAQQPQHGGSCGPLSPGRADSPISSDGRRQLRGSAQTLVQMQPTSARSRH